MKILFIAFFPICNAVSVSLDLAGNPIGRALDLLNTHEQDIRTSAEAEDKTHTEFAEWCDDTSKMAESSVQEASEKKEQLEALIAKDASDAESVGLDVESYASADQTDSIQAEHSGKVRRRSELEQRKAHSEGELANIVKDLDNAKDYFDTIKSYCMRSLADHDETVKARNAELNAIAATKKALSSMTGADQSSSMLMISQKGMLGSTVQSKSDPMNRKVTNLVSRLAFKQRSSMLAQLASDMDSVIRLGDLTGHDVFEKIKGMIADMITKLEMASQSDTTEKAFCDEQLAKSHASKSSLEGAMEKHNAKSDESSAHAEELADQLKDTQAELAALARNQAQLETILQEGQASYARSKEVLEGALESVRHAMSSIFEYTGGGGDSIRTLLETVDSAIAVHLTHVNAEADDLVECHEKMTQLNSVTKALKEQDVKYMTRERTKLEKGIMEANVDASSISEELSAVNEYQDKLKQQCIAQPDSYEERKQKREAELEGLRTALDMLNNENVMLLQRASTPLRTFLAARVQ